MPIDILDFYANIDTYIKVHNLNPKEENWEWEYLGKNVYSIIISLIGLTIITLRFIKKNNQIIQKLNWIFLFMFYGIFLIRG